MSTHKLYFTYTGGGSPGWIARCMCNRWEYRPSEHDVRVHLVGIKPLKLIEHEHFLHSQDATKVSA